MPIALGLLAAATATDADRTRLLLERAKPSFGDALRVSGFPASSRTERAVREGVVAEAGKRNAERSEDESKKRKERI